MYMILEFLKMIILVDLNSKFMASKHFKIFLLILTNQEIWDRRSILVKLLYKLVSSLILSSKVLQTQPNGIEIQVIWNWNK